MELVLYEVALKAGHVKGVRTTQQYLLLLLLLRQAEVLVVAQEQELRQCMWHKTHAIDTE